MLKYKLTTQDNTTRNNTLWGENVTHTTNGKDELCGPGWLHYYHSPEMAVIMNPDHANISNPKLWECEAEGDHKDDRGLKGGCTKLTTIKEIPLPEITHEQKVKFAILCAKQVFKDVEWNIWADKWLNKEDRSSTAAAIASAPNADASAAWAAWAASAASATASAVSSASVYVVASASATAHAHAHAHAHADTVNIDFQSILNQVIETKNA